MITTLSRTSPRRTRRGPVPTTSTTRTWLLRIGPALTLLALWQAVTVAGGWVFFPPPAKILVRVYENWFSGPASSLFLTPGFWVDVVPSVGRALAGLGIAIVIGVVLGVIAGQWSSAAAYIDPPVNFMRSLPKPAIVPIFLLVLGASDGMRIGLIAFGCIWPILLNTMQGVRSVDPAYRESATAFHISTPVTFLRVILPAASPKIAAGIRVSVSLALILMVLSEWMLAMNGLGYFLISAQRKFQVLDLWSAIVLLGLIGYGLNVVFLALERRLLGWHRATSMQS
ncbi:MAG: putative ABC-type nitrate/sulfonate/bicarbonate transport system, permease component [Mycobacterium sp.]|nr:putative ABC-type nitrate/sulfonate/bicarbonate transport system, permease component [Mycobacterium sp.]